MKSVLKACFVLFSICLLSYPAAAQNQKRIDSLLKVLPKYKDDTNKVIVLYDLGWETSYRNLEEGLRYAEQALSLATKLKYEDGQVMAFHDIGSIYVDLGDFQKANEYLFKELRLLESTKSHHSLGPCYIELGVLYQTQNNPAKALHYDSLALAIYKKNKNTRGLAVIYANMSASLEKIGHYEKALAVNKQSIELNKITGNSEAQVSTLLNNSQIYIGQKKYAAAEASVLEAYHICRQQNLTYSLPATLSGLGELYEQTDQTRKAIAYYDSAVTCVLVSGQKEAEMQLYENLSECYEKLGDYEHAHNYHKQYTTLKDSLFDDRKNKEITRNEMKYEFDKLKQAEKLAAEKRDLIAEQEKRRQSLILDSLLIGLLALLIFLFFIYRSYRQKKKINAQLEQFNEQIQEKNKSITDSINYAKRIQNAILPSAKTIAELLPASFVFFLPKDIVSGDFYWMEKTSGKVLFTAVDCTGHGVPGALMSLVAHNNLNRCIKEFGLSQPAAILDKLNELVQETFAQSEDEVRDGMDMALCSIDPQSLVLEYAGANNPLWVISQGVNGQEIKEIKADKQPIGNYAGRKPFTQHQLQLKKGDTVYIFSDGYADQFGGSKGKKFKYKALQQLLTGMQDKTMTEQKQLLHDSFTKWQDQLEQVDDVLIIGLRV